MNTSDILEPPTSEKYRSRLQPLTLTLFAYVVDPLDKEELASRFPGEAQRLQGDPSGWAWDFNDTGFEGLTQPQRMLFGIYLLTYRALKSHDIKSDLQCQVVVKCLGLTEHFSGLVQQGLRFFPHAAVPEKKSPLLLTINPPPPVIDWATSLVFMTQRDQGCVAKMRIPDLDSKQYEHAQDRQMLEALRRTKGFDMFVKKFNEYGIEPLLRVRYTGSNIKISPKILPDLHEMLETACQILGVSPVPELYIQQGFINAMTAGVNRPIIVMDAGCMSLLNHDELLFIIGHELGHIKSQHLLYHNMSMVLPIIGEIVGQATLGIGGLLATGLNVALLNWQRMSEFTADRAGLLCCQNLDAACTVMMKIAGAPPRYYSQLRPEHFLEQARAFSEYDLLARNSVAKVLSMLNADHPWTVMRGGELLKWIDSGAYEQIIQRERP